METLNNVFYKNNIQYWASGYSLLSLDYPIQEIYVWESSLSKIKKLDINFSTRDFPHIKTDNQIIRIYPVFFDKGNKRIVSDFINKKFKTTDIYPLQYVNINNKQILTGNNVEKLVGKKEITDKINTISPVDFFKAPYYSGYLHFPPKSESKYFDFFSIPKTIHQIWIGGEIPGFKKDYMDSIRKGMYDYQYKLWTNEDLTLDNFPITFHLIQSIREYMQKTGKNRYAQIGDIMRLEILYQNGGVYIDTNMEFVKYFGKLLKGTFVVCNEQPCGLDCETKTTKEEYISNGFFASIPYHPILKKGISLKEINFEIPVNKSTGPFYFRKCIKGYEKQVTILPTDYIYPYILYLTKYRKPTGDKCASKISGKDKIYAKDGIYMDFPCKKYPKAYLITHFILGGTWI